MDYEQSKKNIEFSKNFVLPLEGFHVVIAFQNKIPQIFLLKQIESRKVINNFIRNDVPIGILGEEKEQVILSYVDELVTCDFNLFTNNFESVFFTENFLENAKKQLKELLNTLHKKS